MRFIFLFMLFSLPKYGFGADHMWTLTQWRAKSIEYLPPEGRDRIFNGDFNCAVEPLNKKQDELNTIVRKMTCSSGSTSFHIRIFCGKNQRKDSYQLELVGSDNEENDIIIYECRYCDTKCRYEDINLPKPIF